MDVPNVVRKDYQLLDVDDGGFLSLMDNDTGDTREDIALPEGELGDEIKVSASLVFVVASSSFR